VIDILDYRPRRIPSPVWRECIKKIWEVDPLECPKCQAEMKIISFIHEAEVIEKILRHLNLWESGKPARRNRPPPRIPPPYISSVHYEPVDDGWPVYEEPHIRYH